MWLLHIKIHFLEKHSQFNVVALQLEDNYTQYLSAP